MYNAFGHLAEEFAKNFDKRQAAVPLQSEMLKSCLMVFSFLPKNVHFISKNTILCLFLRNVSEYKKFAFSVRTILKKNFCY